MPAPANTNDNRLADAKSGAPVPPSICEAADLAASLITRSLRLLERAIAAQEASPTPPTIKEASATIATIKRAADTLKTLAWLQSPPTPSPAPATAPAPEPVPEPSRPVAPSTPTVSTPSTTPADFAAMIANSPSDTLMGFLDSLQGSLLERVTGAARAVDGPVPLGTPIS